MPKQKYCKYFTLKFSVWLPSSFPSQWKETETNDQRQDQSIVLQNALYELSKNKKHYVNSAAEESEIQSGALQWQLISMMDGSIESAAACNSGGRKGKICQWWGVEDEHLFILIVKFYRRVFYNVSGIIKDKT